MDALPFYAAFAFGLRLGHMAFKRGQSAAGAWYGYTR